MGVGVSRRGHVIRGGWDGQGVLQEYDLSPEQQSPQRGVPHQQAQVR